MIFYLDSSFYHNFLLVEAKKKKKKKKRLLWSHSLEEITWLRLNIFKYQIQQSSNTGGLWTILL